AAPAHSPAVFPLLSRFEDCEGQVSFGCLASGFFPTPAAITWEGVASGEPLSFPEVATAGNELSLSSRVTLPAEEAKNGKFLCRVRHRSSDTKLEIDGGCCAPPTPEFSVSLLADPHHAHPELSQVLL
ncbi:IGHD protein, partial [Copsychus sechellarum]|nr:IGHD protein [Copsychus sechellarum]